MSLYAMGRQRNNYFFYNNDTWGTVGIYLTVHVRYMYLVIYY